MFGKKENNMDKDQYFVIRVWYFDYREKDKYSYNIISEKSFTLDRALSVKSRFSKFRKN